MNPLTPPAACTVTPIDCVALAPEGSRAVTVTVAVPAATGVSVTVLPDALARTTPVRLELGPYVNASPSGGCTTGKLGIFAVGVLSEH